MTGDDSPSLTSSRRRSSNRCSTKRCAGAASSPRSSSRTARARGSRSTTARSRSSPAAVTAVPGIRVIVGDTTGFAHTADLSERGPSGAAEAAAAVARGRRPRFARGRSPGSLHKRREATRPRSERGAEVGQGRTAHAGRRRGPLGGSSRRPGERRLRRQPATHPRRELGRTAHRRRPRPHTASSSAAWRPATAACKRVRNLAFTLGFEMFEEHPVEEAAEHRRPGEPSPSSRRGPPPRECCPWS